MFKIYLTLIGRTTHYAGMILYSREYKFLAAHGTNVSYYLQSQISEREGLAERRLTDAEGEKMTREWTTYITYIVQICQN